MAVLGYCEHQLVIFLTSVHISMKQTHDNQLQWPLPISKRALSICRYIAIDRLVPIELPTRRRRVFRIVAMTGSVAVCLTLRAAVLVWLANRTIFVNSTVSDNYVYYRGCAGAHDEPVVVTGPFSMFLFLNESNG